MGGKGRHTVASELSPIFFPTNLFVHSSVLDCSPPELIPGTTRGILRFVLVVKGLYLSVWVDLRNCVFGRIEVSFSMVIIVVRMRKPCLTSLSDRMTYWLGHVTCLAWSEGYMPAAYHLLLDYSVHLRPEFR